MSALTRIMRPLVRILLRNSVPFKACADMIKWVYADVAMREFGIPGRKPTKSRVAVITGLSRKEVDRLLKLPEPAEQEEQKRWHRATRVLSGWSQDADFQNRSGKPLQIPPEGDEISFQTLVERYSGGTTLRSVLDEVLRVGAVSQNPSTGRLKLINPYYLTHVDQHELQKLDVLGLSAGDLIDTIEHNIQPDQRDPHFQRLIIQRGLSPAQAEQARAYIRQKSQRLANEIDTYLVALAREDSADTKRIERLGLGLYYYQTGAEPQEDDEDQ